jgi:hypothetical protein
MGCLRVYCRFAMFIVVFLTSAFVFAETPLDFPKFPNQYEINSETIYFSDSELLQSDLRLLAGRRFNLVSDRDLRIAVGGYGLFQDSREFRASHRTGAMTQAKISLWKNWFFAVYEYHYFRIKDVSENFHENRYGLYGGYYYEINSRTQLDIYAESFHIPSISKDHLLSTGRASIYWDTHLLDRHVFDLLFEIYGKDAPATWGGSRTDWRIGAKFQPWDFISAKVFVPFVTSEDGAEFEWQAQINIYKVGVF